jgi:serine/threonine protein kinase
MSPGQLNPLHFPLGTRVGPWRVLERRGLGAYGAVYRAIRAQGAVEPVALKLALHPRDDRFAREAELLSRIRHRSVPRLVEHGEWQSPAGAPFPYLVMEWVEGVSLYEWALECRPSSRQVLQRLASLARALEATHAAGGVHRDVKGDNVLVREVDGQVFLTDFGSGHYLGAAPLTWPPFPPGTPEYRSPEAWRSVRIPFLPTAVAYAPVPADDVFALGVTAYRLVTGEYPSQALGADYLEGAAPPAAREVNARCCEELDAVTARMLSASPEARGSARELAETLEHAALNAGPKADVPLFIREAFPPVEARAVPRRIVRRAPERSWPAWLTAASLGGALALGAAWMLEAPPSEEPGEEHASVSTPEEAKDGGAVAVGDSVLTAPRSSAEVPSAWSTIAVDLPPRPLRGQRRPDANGRCPSKLHVSINGGCWIKLTGDLKECEKADAYVHKDGCYVPAFPPASPPTSSPSEGNDDAP